MYTNVGSYFFMITSTILRLSDSLIGSDNIIIGHCHFIRFPLACTFPQNIAVEWVVVLIHIEVKFPVLGLQFGCSG